MCPGPSRRPSVCLRRCSGVGEATPLLVPALQPSRAPSWHKEARGLALCDPRGQHEASVLGDLGLEECLSVQVCVCPCVSTWLGVPVRTCVSGCACSPTRGFECVRALAWVCRCLWCTDPHPAPPHSSEVLLCADHCLSWTPHPKPMRHFKAIMPISWMRRQRLRLEGGSLAPGSSRARLLTQDAHRSVCCQL